MVYQTQHALSEDVTTTKTTNATHAETVRRDAAHGLVEDDVDDDVDVRDGGDGCIPIWGERSCLPLQSYDYDNE